jgi:Cof subfamily protein (haloacid dehalogenase superfamily)
VASDLDGTLLPPSLEFSAKTVAGVAALVAAGVPFVVSTGRMLRSAREMARRLGLVSGPIVCYQGALVADLTTGEWLCHQPVAPDLASEVVDYMRALGRHVNAYVDDRFWVDDDNVWARRYADYAAVDLNLADDLLDVVAGGSTKLVVMVEPEEAPVLLPQLQERWRGTLQVTRSLPHLLEITAAGITKSTALEFVCRRLGVRRTGTITCGDGLNDVDMLLWAGLGVAVAEADEQVRSAAGLVVPRARLGEVFEALARGAVAEGKMPG